MRPGDRASSVAGKEVVPMASDPRTPLRLPDDPYADLDLLLVESDREDRFLSPAPRPDAPEGQEAIDEQILAGLVSP
jgi:hypothetical protein